jgi:hypothetical protein
MKSDLERRLIASIRVRPESFLIHDVPYMGTIDTYMFSGMQDTKFGDIALYTGLKHDYTIVLSTIKELKK